MQQEIQTIDGVNEVKNPEAVLKFGSNVAKMLKDVISKKSKPVSIGGEQYLEFEDWQTVARFYQCTAQVEWSKEIKTKDTKGNELVAGYEARAVVLRRDGSQISAAESMCLKDEPLWSNKPLFQLKSMAQTRACSKALRNVFSWVAVLAGYKSNSAEEMVQK